MTVGAGNGLEVITRTAIRLYENPDEIYTPTVPRGLLHNEALFAGRLICLPYMRQPKLCKSETFVSWN